MLSIGEFSQTARLTVKTLRYYHELGILVPARVDETTGYRYYNEASYEKASAIAALKELGFSLTEVKSILIEEGESSWTIFLQVVTKQCRLFFVC